VEQENDIPTKAYIKSLSNYGGYHSAQHLPASSVLIDLDAEIDEGKEFPFTLRLLLSGIKYNGKFLVHIPRRGKSDTETKLIGESKLKLPPITYGIILDFINRAFKKSQKLEFSAELYFITLETGDTAPGADPEKMLLRFFTMCAVL
jgi:hypothetical protein